jgi:hypothetical protein
MKESARQAGANKSFMKSVLEPVKNDIDNCKQGIEEIKRVTKGKIVKLNNKTAGPKIAEIFASDNTKNWSAQAVSDELNRRGYIYCRSAVGKHVTFKKYRPHNG